MSHVKIWVHAVWCTKNHERVLSKDVRQQLFNHIRENAREKQIYIDFINGDFDHIHCLLTLNADITIAKVIQLIKGEAAYWANLPAGRVCCRTKKLRFTSCPFVKKPSWFFVKGFFVTRSYTKKNRSCTKKEFALCNTLGRQVRTRCLNLNWNGRVSTLQYLSVNQFAEGELIKFGTI